MSSWIKNLQHEVRKYVYSKKHKKRVFGSFSREKFGKSRRLQTSGTSKHSREHSSRFQHFGTYPFFEAINVAAQSSFVCRHIDCMQTVLFVSMNGQRKWYLHTSQCTNKIYGKWGRLKKATGQFFFSFFKFHRKWKCDPKLRGQDTVFVQWEWQNNSLKQLPARHWKSCQSDLEGWGGRKGDIWFGPTLTKPTFKMPHGIRAPYVATMTSCGTHHISIWSHHPV